MGNQNLKNKKKTKNNKGAVVALTKEAKQRAYSECDELNFGALEIDKVYSYKQICSTIGATYLGSYSNGIKKQKELWKKYFDYEDEKGKIRVKGIAEPTKNAEGSEGGGFNRKEAFVRYELGKSKYYGIMYDAIMLTILDSLTVEFGRDKGRVINLGGKEGDWVLLEKSYLKWQVSVGLLSEQFRKYYNKLTGSYTGLIAGQKMVHLTSDIFKKFVKKMERESSTIKFTPGTEILVIDRDNPIDEAKIKESGTAAIRGIEYQGKFYKFLIESADSHLMTIIEACKENAALELGYRNKEEAYQKGKKKVLMDMVGARLAAMRYNDEVVTNDEKDINEDGELVPALRYKIVNYWDTLIVGVSVKFLMDFVSKLKGESKEEEIKEGVSGRGRVAFGKLNELRDAINKIVVARTLEQIDKEAKREGLSKNNGILFSGSYNPITIESLSGRIVKEIFEIKENNKEFFESFEWRQAGVVPIINKNDEIVGAMEEQDDGNVRVYGVENFDGPACKIGVVDGDNDNEGDSEEDKHITLSSEDVLKKLKEEAERAEDLATNINNKYVDVAKGLVTVFGQRGENNYDMAKSIKLVPKEDARNVFGEINFYGRKSKGD